MSARKQEAIRAANLLVKSKHETRQDRLRSLSVRTGSAIPKPLFSCSCEGCAEEQSYYADELFWYAAGNRWVCSNCWDGLYINEDGDLPEKGETLEARLRRVNPRVVDLLQNITDEARR